MNVTFGYLKGSLMVHLLQRHPHLPQTDTREKKIRKPKL